MVTSAQTTPLQQTRSLVRAALGVVTFAALWLILCRYLSAEWYYNEQYNYGWFVPFFALYLFWLRWERRPPVVTKKRNLAVIIALGVVALFLLLPLRLFEIANPGWRPLDWLHTSAVAALTLLAIYMIGGKAWLRHFAFPILCRTALVQRNRRAGRARTDARRGSDRRRRFELARNSCATARKRHPRKRRRRGGK